MSLFVNQRLTMFTMRKIPAADLTVLKELMEAAKVTPVIERIYKLDEVPEAVRYLERGHARGKVAIRIEG
jgi:NADPH:quinone reductase-like Zn-dependent oxidoreductase